MHDQNLERPADVVPVDPTTTRTFASLMLCALSGLLAPICFGIILGVTKVQYEFSGTIITDINPHMPTWACWALGVFTVWWSASFICWIPISEMDKKSDPTGATYGLVYLLVSVVLFVISLVIMV